jgi:hypothetical protein
MYLEGMNVGVEMPDSQKMSRWKDQVVFANTAGSWRVKMLCSIQHMRNGKIILVIEHGRSHGHPWW